MTKKYTNYKRALREVCSFHHLVLLIPPKENVYNCYYTYETEQLRNIEY